MKLSREKILKHLRTFLGPMVEEEAYQLSYRKDYADIFLRTWDNDRLKYESSDSFQVDRSISGFLKTPKEIYDALNSLLRLFEAERVLVGEITLVIEGIGKVKQPRKKREKRNSVTIRLKGLL